MTADFDVYVTILIPKYPQALDGGAIWFLCQLLS